MPSIHPFLWFDTQAEEAAEFYVSVFPNSRVTDVVRYGEYGPGETGTVMTVRFELDGKEFIALNGGPAHAGFNLAVSFVIDCQNQADVDHYWSSLLDGGEASACGWLTDRYGLAWQIVPAELPALLSDPDPARAQAAMQAMLSMTKLDIREMKAAADAASNDEDAVRTH
jgi:predicted 3-demethylubiquinone-9 3-methyltransferase (glyoxalase superfamily)